MLEYSSKVAALDQIERKTPNKFPKINFSVVHVCLKDFNYVSYFFFNIQVQANL